MRAWRLGAWLLTVPFLVSGGCTMSDYAAALPTPSAAQPAEIRLLITPAAVLAGGSTVTVEAKLEPPIAGRLVRLGASNGARMNAKEGATDSSGRVVIQVTAGATFDVSADTEGVRGAATTVPAVDPFRVTLDNQTGVIGDQILYLPIVPADWGIQPVPPVRWAGEAHIQAAPGVSPVVVRVSCGGTPPATNAPSEIRPGVIGRLGVSCTFAAAGLYEMRVEAEAANGFRASGTQRVIVRP